MKNIDKLFKIVTAVSSIPRDEFVAGMERAIKERGEVDMDGIRQRVEQMSGEVNVQDFLSMLIDGSDDRDGVLSDSAARDLAVGMDSLRRSIDGLKESIDKLNNKQ